MTRSDRRDACQVGLRGGSDLSASAQCAPHAGEKLLHADPRHGTVEWLLLKHASRRGRENSRLAMSHAATVLCRSVDKGLTGRQNVAANETASRWQKSGGVDLIGTERVIDTVATLVRMSMAGLLVSEGSGRDRCHPKLWRLGCRRHWVRMSSPLVGMRLRGLQSLARERARDDICAIYAARRCLRTCQVNSNIFWGQRSITEDDEVANLGSLVWVGGKANVGTMMVEHRRGEWRLASHSLPI